MYRSCRGYLVILVEMMMMIEGRVGGRSLICLCAFWIGSGITMMVFDGRLKLVGFTSSSALEIGKWVMSCRCYYLQFWLMLEVEMLDILYV